MNKNLIIKIIFYFCNSVYLIFKKKTDPEKTD